MQTQSSETAAAASIERCSTAWAKIHNSNDISIGDISIANTYTSRRNGTRAVSYLLNIKMHGVMSIQLNWCSFSQQAHDVSMTHFHYK